MRSCGLLGDDGRLGLSTWLLDDRGGLGDVTPPTATADVPYSVTDPLQKALDGVYGLGVRSAAEFPPGTTPADVMEAFHEEVSDFSTRSIYLLFI